MGDGRDTETGQYTEQYDRQAILDALREADGLAGTKDVADAVDCAYETAWRRLQALADEGLVESQKVANARVWLPAQAAAEEGGARGPAQLAAASAASEATNGDAPEALPDAGEAEQIDRKRQRAEAEQVLREKLDLPGRGTDFDLRVEAVVTMYEYLQHHPGQRINRQELEHEAMADQPVGYGGGFESLWSNWIKQNESQGRPENTLDRLPGVEHRGTNYVYTPPEE